MANPKPRPLLVLALPVMVFSAFLTEIKFIPSIANNVGLFEVVGALTIALFFLSADRNPLVGNAVISTVGLIVLVASVSLVNTQTGSLTTGLIQVSILVFLFFFLLALYNLLLLVQISPEFILRWITVSAAIVGPWILRQGFLFSTDIDAVGPFRNRSHMGIYMLTAFWLVLIYTFWPNRARTRWIKAPICFIALSLSLYAVAISGRRSVYLALFIGLVALVVAFTLVLRRGRAAVAFVLAFAIGFLGLLYTQGQDFLPRSEFFQNRVGMIGSRLRAATDAVSGASESGFMAMQAEGIRAAFRAQPVLGIGWGTFHLWLYNPSRHEVHSTPLKFLAEAGVVGLVFYLALLGRIIIGSGRLAIRMRGSPYAASYLALAVAISSLSVSYLYNRHLTERTFWLLLLVFLLLEAFAYGYERMSLRAEEAAGVATEGAAVAAPRGRRRLNPAVGYDHA
ncbi:MAG: hypothetical protein GY769_10995 [bacterium]|nr:hypothetical protein [bacterium]